MLTNYYLVNFKKAGFGTCNPIKTIKNFFQYIYKIINLLRDIKFCYFKFNINNFLQQSKSTVYIK